MKLLPKLLAVTCVALMIAGCKKDSTEETKNPCRITSATINGANIALAYNSDGTLSSVTVPGIGTKTYQYSGNTVTQTTKLAGQFVQKLIVTQNSAGMATNVRTEYTADGTDWDNEVFEYNGNQVSKATYTTSNGDSPEITTFQWTNGNLVSVNDKESVSALDYYNDKSASLGDYLWLIQLLQGYQVFNNKNLVKSIKEGSDVTSITYTFGDDGKIQSLSENDGSDVTNYTFTYQCN